MNNHVRTPAGRPTMLGVGDALTSRLSGEFRDREMEHSFRIWRYDATLPQHRIVGWLLVVTIVPYLWTVYQIMGPTAEFFLLAALRGIQFVVSAWALLLTYRRARYQLLDASALAAGSALLATNAMTIYLTPGDSILMVVQALMVMTACYVLYPGRLIQMTPALLAFSAGFLVIMTTSSTLGADEKPGIIIWTLIANSVGFLASRQLSRFRRIEFLSLLRSEQHAQEMESARAAAVEAQHEAEQANRAKSAMLANTSHELRTPLNAIIGFSDMIRQQMLGPLGNSRYRQYAEDIHGSGRHLLNLIDDLLDLSKIEAGKVELSPEWLDLGEIVDDAVRLTGPRARGAGITIRTSIASGLDLVHADDRSMRQVLINLLTNAIKFSSRGGEVGIVGELTPDGTARIRVLDRGPGFAPGEIERLMQPFQQAEVDPNRPREGWGLGLALVSSLSALNQLDFCLSNRSDGGACAEFLIPPDRVAPDNRRSALANSA